MPQTPGTHTLLSSYARQQKSAIERIINLRRYLFSDGDITKEALKKKIKQNIQPYLTSVDPNKSPIQTQINSLKDSLSTANDVAFRQGKIRDKQTLLQNYTKDYGTAVSDYHESTQQLESLINANDAFLSPVDKRDEYLYTIDEETCGHLCKRQSLEKDCPQKLNDKHNITLTGKLTDAVRIWHNNISLNNLTITDNRNYNDVAHRDGIQLIPPPEYEEHTDDKGHIQRTKMADQMTGTILENATISNCIIKAPHGALQGIFSSDGMCRNLKIDNVEITTQGAHSISIAGALTGCEIKNVTLRQVAGGPVPEIKLFPLRIGGNMADDGVIYIFDFMKGTKHAYGSINESNNKLYRSGQGAEPAIIIDDRRKLPRRYLKIAFGLRDFNYTKYFKEYTTWTVDDFKQNLPYHFEQMKKLINLRSREYSTSVRIPATNNPLPPVSKEQKDRKKFGVWDMLDKANKALTNYDSTFRNTRLPELQETAIRTFSMKCIALSNGKPDDLYELGEAGNKVRRAYLGYLLKDKHFNNLAKNPYGNEKTNSNKGDTKPPLIKAITPTDTWSKSTDLKKHLKISQQTVNKGEQITLFFSSDAPFAGYTYFWKATDTPSEFSKEKTFEIDTSKLNIGDKQRIQIQLSKSGKPTITGSAYINVKQDTQDSTGAAESVNPEPITIKPKGAWSRTEALKTDLRISPSQEIQKGDTIRFFFAKDSTFNRSDYSNYRWSIAGNTVLPTGKDKNYTIDTSKLDISEHRLVFSLSKGGENFTGSVNFKVIKKVDDAQSSSNTQAVSTSENATATTPTTIANNKSWGDLRGKILASPSPAQQGDKVIFLIDTSQLNPETTTFSYFWKLGTQTGNKSTFEVDTTSLSAGEHKINVTLYTKAQGETKKIAVPGGALFKVTQKTETITQEPQTNNTPIKPIKSSGDLGSYIRVSETKVAKGKQTTFSIDPAYIETESDNAKLTYYWSTSKNPASRKASYTVNTNELDSGKQHLVRIALYKTPVGGTRTSLNGMAYFEVVEGSTGSIETGVINFQIMNQDKKTPETLVKYTLTSDSDPSWIHHDETDNQGKVEITNAPLGKYTLKLGDTELGIVLVESN